MGKVDQYDIREIAENAFENILESVEDYSDTQSYNDMTSKQQKEFITKLKIELSKLCDDELSLIDKNWSDDSSEVKQLKNRIKELESQVKSLKCSDWTEDMGK